MDLIVQMEAGEKHDENVEGETTDDPERSSGISKDINDDGTVQITPIKRPANDDVNVGPQAKSLRTSEQNDSRETNKKEKEYLEDEQLCFFNSLPIEVLLKIFSYISYWSDRKKIRRVCKLWYEICNHQSHGETFIENRGFKKLRKRSTYKQFENCGLRNLNLRIGGHELMLMPITIWEKIGTKINSLEFTNCRLGDQVLENVILFCPNLRILKIFLQFKPALDASISIGSVETLEKLNVVRTHLETFEIGVNRNTHAFPFPLIRNVEYGTWQRIFQALFRIFPNVIHYGWKKSYCSKELFYCTFTKEREETTENSEVASVLAHSLSGKSWRTAFDTLSTLRLTSISLNISEHVRKTSEDVSSLLNFFKNSRKLKFIKMALLQKFYTCELRSILFQILNNCSELSELEYFKDTIWLHNLNQEENDMSQLLKLLSKLEKVSMSNFVLKPKSHSLSSSEIYYRCDNDQTHELIKFDSTLTLLCRNYPYLQHLYINTRLSDNVLQEIFKNLVYLKALDISPPDDVTHFGLTGRSNGIDNIPNGYSINRLQNLEKLVIRSGYGRRISEEIFSDLHFPNLQSLYCPPPRETATFALMGAMMPLLKTVHFEVSGYGDKNVVPTESFLALCEFAENLNSLYLNRDILAQDARKLFKICPTLRFVHGKHRIFYYDHLSKKVVCSRRNCRYF